VRAGLKFDTSVPHVMAKSGASGRAPKGETAKSIGSIINDLARQFKASFDRQAHSLGLTRPQWQLLLHLNRHPGMTQTQLAAALELSVPTVANLVHRLVARGWIEIRVDPAHRLNKYLYLLPTAQPKLREVHQLAQKVDVQSLKGMRGEDVARLLELLAGMKRNLSAVRGNGATAASSARRAPAPPKDRGKLIAVRPVKGKARKSGS
jgi:MarR family transcriptional regulator, transcriptional regulator for hemolysin